MGIGVAAWLLSSPPAARADHGQPGGQAETILFAYHDDAGESGSIALAAEEVDDVDLDSAGNDAVSVADAGTFQVIVVHGPVTNLDLTVNGVAVGIHTSCSLPMNPGLVFGPGAHNVVDDNAGDGVDLGGAAFGLEVVSFTLGNGQASNAPNCTAATTPTATPTPTPTSTPTATPTSTPTATPTSTPTATPTSTPTATPTSTPPPPPPPAPTAAPTAAPTPAPLPLVLSTAISKTLVSSDPAAIGETVTFDIRITFEGPDALVDAELIDVFENRYLQFQSVSLGGVALSCELFESAPDGAHDMAVCDLGTLSGAITVQASFTALEATTPDRTVNEASAAFDADGDGPKPRMAVGPVEDDVEIVEVLALPPLGDGPLAGGTAAGSQPAIALLALATALAVAGARVLSAAPAATSGRRQGR